MQIASQELPDVAVFRNIWGNGVELCQAYCAWPQHHQAEEGGGDTGHDQTVLRAVPKQRGEVASVE